MKISCPSCSAKYSIADEKVQNRLAKIRCRKCGTSIVIDGNVSPANVYSADGAPAPAPAPQEPVAPAAIFYSVDLGENDQRQMSTADVVAAYNTGTITAETYVWTDGFADWMALGQVEELVAALHSAANADAPTAATDEVSAAAASAEPESPWDNSSDAEPPQPVTASQPEAAPQPAATPAYAAVAAPAPAAAGTDLFGGVATAGSGVEAAPVASPSPSASSTPFGSDAGSTGARNESSVLFSLSALTSGASNSRPSVPPAAVSGGNDDSGLIDLKALTESAEAHAVVAPAPIAQSPFGMPPSPLGGAPSPLGGHVVGASMPPQQQKSNTGLYIAGGIVVAAIAVASIMTFGGSAQEPVAAPAPPVAPAPVAAAPAPAPIPTAAPAPLPTADAKPPSTGTEQDAAAPKTTAPKVVSKPRPKSSSSSASSSSPSPSPAAAPAPKPKSSVGKCGCKKDDLMCLMNCAQ